jgi:hypothetical protein
MHFGLESQKVQLSEIAYDGHRYHADERNMDLEIPNPLFLLLEPLNLVLPDCPFCELRLSDLRSLWALHQTGMPEKSLSVPMDTSGFGSEVTLTATGSPATSVLSKREVGLVERSEFSEYRSLQGMSVDLPRSVNFLRTVEQEGSTVRIAAQYQIDELEIDRPIDDAVFTLDRSPYASIWENDHFVRSPRCSKYPTPPPMR